MSMWERWRAEIDLSLREAELSRARREEPHLRELRLQQSAKWRRDADPRDLERSVRWLARAAQSAAAWLF